MNRLGLLCVLLFLPSYALATDVFYTATEPYQVETIAWPTDSLEVYGELMGFPHTWSFTVATTTVFYSELGTNDNDLGFSQILIREEIRGVKEIVRQNGQRIEWDSQFDARTGVAVATAPAMRATITPGTYRLEVSTPDNLGEYRLTIGEGRARGGWGSAFLTAWRANQHFGSFLGALRAPVVWVPLLLIIGGAVYWYRRRNHA